MTGQPAIVLMEHELTHIIEATGRAAAREVIDTFRAEIASDPTETIVRRLRAFLADRCTESQPRDVWANGLHIRSIKLSSKGKPLSPSWFQQFKVESGLGACLSRKSQTAGGTREWCFEDIANAWEQME